MFLIKIILGAALTTAVSYFYIWPRLKPLLFYVCESLGWAYHPWGPPKYALIWEDGGFTVNHVTPLSKSKRAWIDNEYKKRQKEQKAYDARQKQVEYLEHQIKIQRLEEVGDGIEHTTMKVARLEQQLMNLKRLQEIHNEEYL